jgi:hypothetical protein
MPTDTLGIPTAAEVSAELAEGRAAWLAIAVDTCRITKSGGAPVFDEGTGEYTDREPITVYEGPCRLQIRADVNSNVVEVTAGEKEWAYQTAMLAIPVLTPTDALGDTADVRIDQTATMLTCAEDPGLAGRVFQIRALMHKTHATSRRLRVSEAV